MEKLLYLILLVTVFQCNGYQPTHRDYSATPDRTIQTAIGLGQSIFGTISQGLGFNFGQQNSNKPQVQPTHVEEQSNFNENHWQKPPHGHGNHQGQHPHKPSHPEKPNGNYGSEFANQELHGQGPYPNNYHHHHHHHHHHHPHGQHPEHPSHHHQGNINNNGDFNTNSEHPNHQHQGQNHPGRPTNQHHGSHSKPGHENFHQNNQPNHETHQQHLITGQHNSGSHNPFGNNPNNQPLNGFPTNPSPSPVVDKMTEDPMKGIPAFLALIPMEPVKATENGKPETDAEDFEIDIRFKDQ